MKTRNDRNKDATSCISTVCSLRSGICTLVLLLFVAVSYSEATLTPRTVANAMNADGRLEVFMLRNGTLYHNFQIPPGGGGPWSGWISLGGNSKSIVAATNADGHLEVFAIDHNDNLEHIWQDWRLPGGWSSWSGLGVANCEDLATVRNVDGRLEVFTINSSNNGIYHAWQTHPSAGPWANSYLTGVGDVASRIAAAVDVVGRTHVFALHKGDGAVMWYWSGTNMLEYMNLRKSIDLTAAINADGRIEVFAISTDNTMYHIWQAGVVSVYNGYTVWSGWSPLYGYSTALATARNKDGRLELFAIGKQFRFWFIKGGYMFHMWQDWRQSTGWSSWVPLGGVSSQVTAAANHDGHLELFAVGSDGRIYHIWQDLRLSGGWSPWYLL